MVDTLCPIEAKLAKDALRHLVMIVLLVTNNLDMLVKTIFSDTQFCCTAVLSHINGCSVTAQKKLSVKSVSSKVPPYRSILLLLEYACLKSLLNECLSEKIGL